MRVVKNGFVCGVKKSRSKMKRNLGGGVWAVGKQGKKQKTTMNR